MNDIRKTAAALLLPLALLSAPASAQSADLEALRLCAGLETDALKLACFEALAAERGASGGAVETPRAAAAVTLERGATGSPAPEGAAKSGVPDGTADASETGAAAAAPADAQPSAAERPLDANVGRRHLDAAEREAEPEDTAVVATIVNVTRSRGSRRLYFEMDNGQVWRQMETDRFFYPKDGPFEVEIRQGMMGDYQMRVGGEGRMTRIVRVK